MNSYLVTYKYSYNEEPSEFTKVVEGQSYKEAAEVFAKEESPATIVAMKVLPNAETNYTQLKNHLHNTLHLSKAHIRILVNEAVEDIVNKRVDILFRDKYEDQWTIQRIIDDTIKDKTRDWFWGESETNLEDYIKTEVVKGLLKSVKMKVELVKTQKDATPAHKTRVISRKKT